MLRFFLIVIGLIFLFSVLARALRGFRNAVGGYVVCKRCSVRNPKSARVCRNCGGDLRRESRVPEYTVED